MNTLAHYLINHALELRLVMALVVLLGMVGMAQALTLLDIYLDKRHAARQEKPVTPQVALTVI